MTLPKGLRDPVITQSGQFENLWALDKQRGKYFVWVRDGEEWLEMREMSENEIQLHSATPKLRLVA